MLILFLLLSFSNYSYGFLEVPGVLRSLSTNLLNNNINSATGNLMNLSLIRLKKENNVLYEDEVECVETMFMSPFHNPVTFSLNSSIRSRQEVKCKWDFIGTEPCIPKISCSTFQLKQNCDDEYLEIFDGYSGISKFCGNNGPLNITASGDLRDLYITFKGEQNNKNNHDDNTTIFNCTVICSSREKKYKQQLAVSSFTPKINPKCLCGSKPNDNRIVGGVDAIKNEFPWLVALVESKTRQPFCGGSIINDRMILTAGHCFKGRFLDISNVEVLVNAHQLDPTPNLFATPLKPVPKRYEADKLLELDSGNGSKRFIPQEIYVHPLYVAETNDFDVATIRLSSPINFDSLSHPICLPEPGSYLRTFGRRKATIAGWGLPKLEATETPTILQKVDVNVFAPTECKKFYAHRVNRRMLCAGYKNGGRDSCAGDSGGPLVLEDRPKVWYQIGAVSWGDGCAKEENPGVYFRTTESGQWLHHHSNKNDAIWCQTP